jgi:hypothetical protein
MGRDSLSLKLFSILSIVLLVIVLYSAIIRSATMGWGATELEIWRAMPGDELVPNPTFNSTRAVTIQGKPEDIWPWLVQMGYGRAGFYGYDLIENLGSERGLHSATRIHPELQQLAIGDEMPISFIATYDIQMIERDRFLVWDDEAKGAFTWGLYPLDDNNTRLVLRFRFQHSWLDWIFTDWADQVAVPKILLGIKDRVEGRVEPIIYQNIEITVWIAALLVFIGASFLILSKQDWWRAWFVALAAAATLLFTLYRSSILWIEVVMIIGLLVGLVWASRFNFSIGELRNCESIQLS